MERASQNPVISDLMMNNILGAMVITPPAQFMTSPHVVLFTAGPGTITPASVPADFTIATFGGYADAVPSLLSTWRQVGTGVSYGQGFGAPAVFNANVTLVPPGQVALGYMVTKNDYSEMYFSEYFLNPVAFGAPGDWLNLYVMLPVANPGIVAAG